MSDNRHQQPKIIFSDFDGTLTDGHILRPCFFEIIHFCEEKKLPFVIVTGRSKSWGHFFLTHFPQLQWVISEGGGVLNGRGKEGELEDQLLLESKAVEQLESSTKKLLKNFPEVSLSADSFGRQTDRSIDLSWLKRNPVSFDKIKEFFKKEGVHWSTSNVHLNYWCGKVSKAKAIDFFLKEKTSFKKEEGIFFGDALNDQSAFQYFPHSVGVSNIEKVMDQIESPPSVVLEGENNAGPKGVLNYLKALYQ